MLTVRGNRRECRPGISRRDVLRGRCIGPRRPDPPRNPPTASSTRHLSPRAAHARQVGHHDLAPRRGIAHRQLRHEAGRPGRDPRRVPADRARTSPASRSASTCRCRPGSWTSSPIIRGIRSNDLGDHTPHYILTGFPDRGKRPVLRLGRQLPAAAATGRPAAVRQPRCTSRRGCTTTKGPTYLGPAHRPFVPQGRGAGEPEPGEGRVARPLDDRRELLGQFDDLQPRGRSTGAWRASTPSRGGRWR